jgi:hypothetical protein
MLRGEPHSAPAPVDRDPKPGTFAIPQLLLHPDPKKVPRYKATGKPLPTFGADGALAIARRVQARSRPSPSQVRLRASTLAREADRAQQQSKQICADLAKHEAELRVIQRLLEESERRAGSPPAPSAHHSPSARAPAPRRPTCGRAKRNPSSLRPRIRVGGRSSEPPDGEHEPLVGATRSGAR